MPDQFCILSSIAEGTGGDYMRRTQRKRPSTSSASRFGREQRRALEMLAHARAV
jgi:hypothetical protein